MKFRKHFFLFCIGGTIYLFIEGLWKSLVSHGTTSFTMFLLGGIVFLLIGLINEQFRHGMSFWLQIIIGTIYVTVLEFVFGCVLNLWLGMHIWDYSNVPLNLAGQICVPFILIWTVLVAVAIVIDDWLRHILFGECKPKYNFGWKFVEFDYCR